MEYALYRTKKTAKDKRNLENAIKLVLQNLEPIKKDYKVYNIKNFGRLLEGEAYYHEVDAYYQVIGFEIEIESQIAFDNGELSDVDHEVGFYSIWVGKSHSSSPITFEEGNDRLGECYRFDNGLGDRVRITEVIATLEEVQQLAKGIAI